MPFQTEYRVVLTFGPLEGTEIPAETLTRIVTEIQHAINAIDIDNSTVWINRDSVECNHHFYLDYEL